MIFVLVILVVVIVVIILLSPKVVLPVVVGQGLPNYISRYEMNSADNKLDGCIKRGTDGKCLATACQVDLHRVCEQAMVSNNPGERTSMIIECERSLTAKQCNPASETREFNCAEDRILCNYYDSITSK